MTSEIQKKTIFISHAEEDAGFAEALVKLIENGIGVDPNEIFLTSKDGYGVAVGKDFVDSILKEIEAASIVILILSKNYFKSDFCICEMGIARYKNSINPLNLLYPLLVPPLTYAELPIILKHIISYPIVSANFNDLRSSIKDITKGHNIDNRWDEYRKEFTESITLLIERQKKNFNYNERICLMKGNVFFDDMIRTVQLIDDKDVIPIENFSFIEKASKDRNNESCVESRYVFPLTDLTLNFFLNAKNRHWFDDEERLSHSIKRRVVIIEEKLQNDLKTKQFLKRYQHLDWKIILKSQLEAENIKYFRDFCIFTYKDDKNGSKIAYFTYLDSKHHHLFIKGSWSQYKTINPGYITVLEGYFTNLYKISESSGLSIKDQIKIWESHDGEIKIEPDEIEILKEENNLLKSRLNDIKEYVNQK